MSAPRAERRVVLSVDLDEWYHCRWASGAPHSRWPSADAVFREYYKSDQPGGELIAPTRRILALFDKLDVRATFFILGEVAEHYPDLVREIAAAGHEIGCHGFHHTDADLLGPEGFADELRRGRDALGEITGHAPSGYRAPNLILRDWMIPILRDHAFRFDASVCTSRRFWKKDFGHSHHVLHPYRISHSFGEPDPEGDFAELPLPVFPGIRLPAGTGILTRVLGRAWTTVALRNALRTGDTQYYFHPYEIGPLPRISMTWRERLFLRRLGGWLEGAVGKIVTDLRESGAVFVTAGDQAARILGN